jgi:hypothetical protein
MNKALIKKKYEHLVNLEKKMESFCKDFPLTQTYILTIYVINAKRCICAGLLNNNKSQYNLGIAKFIQYSTESIDLADNEDVICLHVNNKITVYKSSEGKRQLGLKFKKQYDEYISWGKEIF